MGVKRDYQPVDCGLYDYLEVACMHGYEISLALRNGKTDRGVAITVGARREGEFLTLATDQTKKEYRLDELRSLRVLSYPRSFDEISFE